MQAGAHVLMHLCIRTVWHVRSDCAHKSLATLQSRCKTFISRGDALPSAREDESVSEGNWRSPLSATNASGDALPRDASFQLCFSSPFSQPSLLIVSLLSFCPAVMYTPHFSPSDFGCFWRPHPAGLHVTTGTCWILPRKLVCILQRLSVLQPLFWGHPSSFRWRIKWLWNANAAN